MGGLCPYGLTAGSRPLRPGHGGVLPLRPCCGQAAPCRLAIGGHPLRAPRCMKSCLQVPIAPAGWPQPIAPCARGHGHSQSPLCWGALAIAGCPLIGGQDVVGRPSSSSLRLLRKRSKNA
ncbi:hypothetical protein B296_00040020 [Ensete ventricosum]|uniref:Uncharacterized protein n=1 Tax=Ensete ventricosum TaxID=4639 RepID=A0A426Z084_ENSVE|nr:hypothetical protein B296_00040020 [Ensete ventricosum]